MFIDFDGETHVDEYDFSWGTFWLQLQNILFKFMTEQIGRVLGLKVGFVEEVVMAPWSGITVARSLKARVCISVSTPMNHGS